MVVQGRGGRRGGGWGWERAVANMACYWWLRRGDKDRDGQKKHYLLSALSISMVTKTDRAIVMGSGAEKMLQSTPLNSLGSAGHCMWWVCKLGQQTLITTHTHTHALSYSHTKLHIHKLSSSFELDPSFQNQQNEFFSNTLHCEKSLLLLQSKHVMLHSKLRPTPEDHSQPHL